MIKGHTIELIPNNKQATYFAKACGVARLAYNWALAEWQNQYQADKVYRDNCQKNGIIHLHYAITLSKNHLKSINKEFLSWCSG